jgi:Secretion system C-terminal sorting domain
MRKFRFLLCLWALAPLSSFSQTIEEVSGTITQNTIWSAEKTYLLTGYVYVKNGATLTILPGTVIKGDKSSKGTLIVTRGSKIIADGKRSQPIVFTSNETNPAPGDWGGVVICGYAPVNAGMNGYSCLATAEGGINTPSGDAVYGSGDQTGGCGHTDDNSGVLRFVRIEYAGIPFQLNNETNGLTLAGVGNGTTIDYVQVSHSGDDAFEFFGGTVNCKHLIAYGSRDDDFDCDLGYRGNVQFALAVRNPDLSDVSGSNGLEIDNDNAGNPTTPKTRPTFSNLTIVGPTGAMDDNYRRAAHLRRNAEPAIYNSLFIGNFPVGLFIDGLATITNAQNNLLEIKTTYFADAPELLKTTESSFNINQWFSNTSWNNSTMTSSAPLGLVAPFNLEDPNAQPQSNSTIATGASFTPQRASGSFFEKVAYIGAFSTIEDWSCGWAKFANLNTDCTVGSDEAVQPFTATKISPTVADQSFVLEVALTTPSDITVELFDLNGRYYGRPVTQKNVSGNGVWTIATSQLNNGFYFVKISAGNTVRTERVMVVR